ncbi:MAG TPA: RDD family protein [Pyrinomonadaceae bacterium]
MPQLVGDATKARVFAFIIDNLIACLLSLLLVGKINSANSFVSGSILSLTYLLYFFGFELALARTPGKIFQGLEIRDIEGGKCSPKQTFIRTLTRILEANPVLFGGLPAALLVATSVKHQRMGDSLAGTVVVPRNGVVESES